MRTGDQTSASPNVRPIDSVGQCTNYIYNTPLLTVTSVRRPCIGMAVLRRQ